MLLADMVIVWVGGLLLSGFVGFFTLVIAAIARVLRAIFRAVFGGQYRSRGAAQSPPQKTLRACPQPRCGFLNPGHARFCARCGHALQGVDDAARYG